MGVCGCNVCVVTVPSKIDLGASTKDMGHPLDAMRYALGHAVDPRLESRVYRICCDAEVFSKGTAR
jgi:hypothetical protein